MCRLLVLAAVLLAWPPGGAAQTQPPIRILNPTNPNPIPSDARMMQFDFEAKGANWRVFAVNTLPDAPIGIVQVEEVRQQNPPSLWGAYLVSRAPMPVETVSLVAAVVDVNGAVKATQPMPTIKNLKPGQLLRRETRIRVTQIAPTDRVVFFLKEVAGEVGEWKADDGNITALIRAAAQRLPVP
jgi:hypothetical protein